MTSNFRRAALVVLAVILTWGSQIRTKNPGSQPVEEGGVATFSVAVSSAAGDDESLRRTSVQQWGVAPASTREEQTLPLVDKTGTQKATATTAPGEDVAEDKAARERNVNLPPTEPDSSSSTCPDWDCRVENDCVSTIDGTCSRASGADGFHRFKFRPEPGPNQVVPSGGTDKEELRCAWQVDDPVRVPPLNLGNATHAASDPETIWKNFQHLTGGYFQKWYDIKAPIGFVKKNTSSFRFSAQVQGNQSVYVMKNLCIRPSGQLAGFHPSTHQRFTGENELSAYQHYRKKHVPEFNKWLVRNFERLESEPEWFINQRLAIFPIIDQPVEGHSPHYLWRQFALLYNTVGAFPKPLPDQEGVQSKSQSRHSTSLEQDWAPNDVTTLYLRFHVPNPKIDKVMPKDHVFQDRDHKRYTTLAARSHLFAFANYDTREAARIWLRKTSVGRDFAAGSNNTEGVFEAFNRPVCFREAVFQQACASGDCGGSVDKPKFPWAAQNPARDSWRMVGPKNFRTQQVIAKRFRACAAVDSSFVEDPTGPPRLLYAMRRTFRGSQHKAFLLGQVLQWLKRSAPGATLTVNEVALGSLPIAHSVAMMAQTDIIIGFYGGGFSYSFVMPPGVTRRPQALMLLPSEIRPFLDVWRTRSKFIKIQDTNEDYPGIFHALNGDLTSIELHSSARRNPSGQHDVSAEVLERGLNRSLCLFFNRSTGELPLSEQCWASTFSQDSFEPEPSRLDPHGFALSRIVRAHFTPAVAALVAPRLDSLRANFSRYALAFQSVRSVNFSLPSGQTWNVQHVDSPPRTLAGKNTRNTLPLVMLVAFSPPAEGRQAHDFLPAAQAELRILREHVSLWTRIHVLILQSNTSAGAEQAPLFPDSNSICGRNIHYLDNFCSFCPLWQNPRGDGVVCIHEERSQARKTLFEHYDLVVADNGVMRTHGELIAKLLDGENNLIIL